ncbi:hypothetical protein NDU88_001552 [Pleurodeles waltl]|uniref:Uncharacterized protein n=1 Tax=Pleurodeles waltl TaxID=8319 RepID=A0AAV7NF23_PLEWA|nr:hypothetical protein NDU88_001552 [Pleurodeles waltl]
MHAPHMKEESKPETRRQCMESRSGQDGHPSKTAEREQRKRVQPGGATRRRSRGKTRGGREDPPRPWRDVARLAKVLWQFESRSAFKCNTSN